MDRSRLRRLRAILACSAAVLSLTVAAAAQPSQLAVPEQSLADSLRSIAQKTGHNILFTPDTVAGLRGPAISGSMTAAEAVGQLIRGTNLEAVSDGADGLIIRRAPAPHTQAAASPPEPPSRLLPVEPETIVVTGSRIISNAANSPTPLTVISVEQLSANTPSNITDALNKLPDFEGGTNARSTNNNSVNSAGSTLNLRNFGAQRVLVLLDGHRITPANANGTVDLDSLPQMLISRVEAVTGGASAVYGSDAVTGVVNFITDRHFTGVKFNLNAGVSGYGDAASYNAGLAAGIDLLTGRGHFEIAMRRFYEDGVASSQRAQGPQDWALEGNGTAAQPYTNVEYANNTLFGGHIVCGAGCAANGMRFGLGSTIVPFDMGVPTGTTNISSGGDGGHSNTAQVTSTLETNEIFARLHYDFGGVGAYLQASASDSYTKGAFQNHEFAPGLPGSFPGEMVPGTFFNTNPYLSPAAQASLAGATGGKFAIADYWDQGYPRSGQQSNGLDRSLSITAGLEGSFAERYDWDLFFSHGDNRLDVNNPGNEGQQKMYAGSDLVIAPTGTTINGVNVAGTVVCYVSTTQYASLYPGCVPADPFSQPNAVNESYNKYISIDTRWISETVVDDLGGSIAGVLLDLPAGPLKAALNGEARWMRYGVVSNASPLANVDCTGLRICNPTTPLYQNNTVSSLPAVSEDVWELAAEADIPLLKHEPLIEAININLAGRFTDYSTSGPVETWKVGLDWHVDSGLRVRATNSIDIRAPTLNDLFSPVQRGVQSFSDLLTGAVGQNQQLFQGNPELQPEVARTYTAGIVLTPDALPGLTASIDYYNIVLKNAITMVSGNNTAVQTICNNSNGTSPFCDLYVRPYIFGDPLYRSAANFPTQILARNLNTAFNKVEGWDIDIEYQFALASIADILSGAIAVRLLANIQPVTESSQYAGAPLVLNATGNGQLPRGRVTAFVAYRWENWGLNLEDRWYSSWSRISQYGQVYAPGFGTVPAREYLDVTVDRRLHVDDTALEAYLSVQNLANVQPPVAPTNSSTPGLYYMGVQGPSTTLYDAIGRYFTLGLRAQL